MTMRSTTRRWPRLRPAAMALVAVLALVVAACGGGDDDSDDGAGAGPTAPPPTIDPAECGLDELAAADKPVTIQFWHTMVRANEEWLKATIDEFNDSQADVRVELTQFPSYQDLLTKYLSGLSTGDLPTVGQFEETVVQKLIDSESTVPVQACVDADDYDLSAFVPAATAYYSYRDTLRAMPWAISNPILYFDVSKFEAAGLDPADPPATLDEVREYAQQIVDSGAAEHGLALRVEPYIFEFLNAKSGATYVNNGNGRQARADAATLDTDVAREVWTWWKDMVDSGLALNTGGAPGNIDHMLAIGNGQAAMVMEASGVLGTVRSVLESGQFPGVEVATAPLPSLDPSGGVPVGDGALWLTESASPAERGAAWQLVKHLASAEQQAALAVAGGYAPIRTDAEDVPALAEKWSTDPIFRTAYDQLRSGTLSDASVGSLIGDYQGVRDAVRDGLLAMLTEGKSPDEALAQAQDAATAAIAAYNDRVG